MMSGPFIGYYGGKWRAAPRYPKPEYGTIIEPFAGAAGYAMRYCDRRVILIEKYDRLAAIWDYLIRVSPDEIMRIPECDAVADLPSWVPAAARDMVGFSLNQATSAPCKVLSAGSKKLRAMGRNFQGWTAARKERTARQVALIKHWQVLHGDYTDAPGDVATWFVDPPYNNKAGSYYVHSAIDYQHLGAWCMRRRGQVLVCENAGATWLPFEPFAKLKAGVNGKGSEEVLFDRAAWLSTIA